MDVRTTTAAAGLPSASEQSWSSFASRWLIVILFLSLICLMVASLAIGRYPVPLARIVGILASTGLNGTSPYSDREWVIIEIIRLPRILGVVLCGMGLAMAGAAMQGVFRNPLVGPEVAGVSAGASFGGVVAILMSWSLAMTVALAFGFGLLALAIAFALAKITMRGSTLALVLAGVIVGGFFSSLTGLAQYVANPVTQLPSIVYWLLGSFATMTYQKAAIVAAVMTVSGPLLMSLRWRMNLLSLGEVDAQALGVNVERLRWGILALVAVMVAAQVAVSGGIGLVGLVVPHLARMLVGPEHSRLLPASAVVGGIYLLGMDDLARTITAQEIPIGLITSMVGMPIFAYLFWSMQGRGWNRE